MVNEFDVRDFLANCKASKPPYNCPCGKTYKSLSGIQQHVNISHLINSTSKKKILNTNKKNPMYYDEDSNTNFNSNNVAKTRETLTYAEAQRMIEVEIEGIIHRININEPMNIVCLDPEANKNDKITLESFQTPELFSNHVDSYINKYNSTPQNIGNAKKTTKKGRSKTKESSMKSAKNKFENSNHGTEPIKIPEPSFRILNNRNIIKAPVRPISYYRYIDKSTEELDETIEYDMDEEDFSWLDLINKKRLKDNLTMIPPDTFELLMDRLEKECYFLNQTNGNGDYYSSPAIDEDAVCCICNDGECQNSNAILFCDMCDLPVHQECYGVPYIPEGQWLCRRCLQSPSRGVTCILCPNNGGAFKQTDDGRWCHVVCALWIPEVCFANTVFLEPIDNISAIPTARWRLICYICKEKNNGACIQCHKSNCYVAFHVTCAQQAGLHMRMEAVRELSANGMNTYIRKEAYCHTHMPEPSETLNFTTNRVEDQNDYNGFSNDEESESSFSDDDSNLNSKKRKKSLMKKSKKLINLKENSYNEATLSQRRQIKAKMKKARRILAEKRSACPTVSIPTIPAERLTEIAQLINIPKRNQFVQRLLGYWTLKRESRNGVPLLRRLQVSHANSCKALKNEDDDNEEHKNEQTVQLKAELKEMYRLRQDLERARILIELIRKREKIKREAIRNLEQTIMLQINPFNLFLDSVLNLLKSKDVNGFFLEPVDTNEVHDYLQFIERPMSFFEMKRKIDKFEYISFDDFEKDFNQIIENCTIYNEKHTVYFKAATKLKEQSKIIFKQARSNINETGYDQKKGIHHPEVLMEQPSPFSQFAKDDRKKELEAKLEQLKIDLGLTHLKKSGGTKSKKLKQINAEIEIVKKELACLEGFNSFFEKDDQSLCKTEDTVFNSESPSKSKNLKCRSPQKITNDQNKKNQKPNPLYPVFNFKSSKNEKTNSSNSLNKKKNDKSNKNKKSSELNMKPITSYLQLLPNSDSFKIYRSKSDSSDSASNSDSSSSESSSNSSSCSSSSSSSINGHTNNINNSSYINSDQEDYEEKSRKKMKKT